MASVGTRIDIPLGEFARPQFMPVEREDGSLIMQVAPRDLFDVDTAKLKETSHEFLDQLAASLTGHVKGLRIIGTGDGAGDDADNLELGKKRALALASAVGADGLKALVQTCAFNPVQGSVPLGLSDEPVDQSKMLIILSPVPLTDNCE